MISIFIVPFLYAISPSEKINKLLEDNEQIILKIHISHQREPGYDGGGYLYITTRRFIFIPHIFPISRARAKTMFIDTEEIDNIELFKEENTFKILIKSFFLEFRLINKDDREKIKMIKSKFNI
jgi:hypothetical protein